METTNFDKAFTTAAKRLCRNETEQRIIWKEKLEEELECERQDIDGITLCKERMIFWEEELTLHNQWEQSISTYASYLNSLFVIMNRIAYFDGLLGGTGISKTVTETVQISTDSQFQS